MKRGNDRSDEIQSAELDRQLRRRHGSLGRKRSLAGRWWVALSILSTGLSAVSAARAEPLPTHPTLAILGHPDSIPVAVSGAGFGEGATGSLDVISGSSSTSIPGDAECGGPLVHTCIEHWGDDLIVARLSPSSTAARLRVATGACPEECSEYVRAQYYAYDYAKTLLPEEAAGVPIALDVGPEDPLHRVWLIEEAHHHLKVLVPGEATTSNLPIVYPSPAPFFTRYLNFPAQSTTSQNGEDVMVDPHGRIWFSQGGWPGEIEPGYWNYSRIVMYRYDPQDPSSIIETRVYNLPGHDSQVLGLAYEAEYEPGRDRVWYSIKARKPSPFFGPIIPARIGWFDPDEPGLAHDGSRAFTTTTACVQFSCTSEFLQSCCADNSTRRCANTSLDCAGSNEVCYSDEPPNPSCKFHEYRLPVTHIPAHMEIGLDGALWFADYWGESKLGRIDPSAPDGDLKLYPLGDDPARGPSWLLGAAPWEIQIASNGDVLVNEYSDLVIDRFDIDRFDDPLCETLVGLQNPCVESVSAPGPVAGYALHTIDLDARENLWFTTLPVGALNSDPDSLATVGYVKRDWSDVVLFPSLTLFPLAPGELTAASACANPDDPLDPFRAFHGTGIAADPQTEDVWFGDFCRKRIGRLSPTVTNLALGQSATQASTIFDNSADRAVDGNVDGILPNGSVAQTIATLPVDPWWQVDLGSVQFIDEIEVWNRTDPQAVGWLQNYYVLVSDAPFVSGSLAAVLAQPGVTAIHHPGPAGVMSTSALRRNGRYVRVQLVGNNSLALAEVVVLGKVAPNIARGKTASQASTIFGNAAGRAVDGNINGALGAGSVAQTVATLPSDPWWQVDLGSVQFIDEIEVWNRTDPQAIGWLQNYYVLVSDVPFVSTNLAAVLAQPGVTAIHHAEPAGTMSVSGVDRTGRYVRVQLTGSTSLALAEVVVSGSGQ